MNDSGEHLHERSSFRRKGTFISSALTGLTVLSIGFLTDYSIIYEVSIYVAPFFYGLLFGLVCKDLRIAVYAPLISTLSIRLIAPIFPPSQPTLSEVLIECVFSAYNVALFSALFIPMITMLWTRPKISRRVLVFLPLPIFAVGLAYVIYLFSSDIFVYLDQHPWIATVFVGVLTLMGGIIVGRWQREK